MKSLSAELIAIIATGVALASLLLVSQERLEDRLYASQERLEDRLLARQDGLEIVCSPVSIAWRSACSRSKRNRLESIRFSKAPASLPASRARSWFRSNASRLPGLRIE